MPEKKPRAKNVRANRAKRWLYVQGEITPATATNFEKQLRALAKEGSAPIVVFLNSRGGDVYACLKMYHLIMNLREKQTPVYTAGVNIVQSGAFFILQAGTRRFAMETTTFMFHCAVRHYAESMNTARLMEEFQDLAIIDAMQLVIYTKRGRPIRKVKELFSRDETLTAEQARALHLVDAIIQGESANLPRLLARIIS
ncbi:MAG: ATP-dependent Clp protease proteolytic subunit [Parcubacteria group bacterium]|nr:ATP-dependent Clp protease proteolytic subunit [Parcubacteria group bacterium]